MTYCAGWKYKNSVYLLADTVATKLSIPKARYTSFGQLQDHVRGEHVEECLLKIIPIGQGAAVAFAGDVQLAAKIIEFLRDNLPNAQSSLALIEQMELSLGPFARQPDVAILFARTSTTGDAELLRWTSRDGLDEVPSDYHHIGSLTSYHAALTPELLGRLLAGNLDPERVLPVTTAIVQSYGVHDNLIDLNVGGLIFGLRTFDGEIFWQDDTNFILYDNDFSNPTYISALVRENALFVSSSGSDDTRVFAHSASTSAPDISSDVWRSEIRRQLDSGQCKYWVFISTASKLITLIIRRDVTTEGKYVRLTNNGEGHFSFALSPELMTLLLRPLEDRADGSIPFRMNVRND